MCITKNILYTSWQLELINIQLKREYNLHEKTIRLYGHSQEIDRPDKISTKFNEVFCNIAINLVHTSIVLIKEKL